MARRAFVTGLLEAEEIESLVVLVAAPRDGREVIPPAAGQACRTAAFGGPLAAASAASTRRFTAAHLGRRPSAVAAATLAAATPPAAARAVFAGPFSLGPIPAGLRRTDAVGSAVGTAGRVRFRRPHEVTGLQRLVVDLLPARRRPQPVTAAGGGGSRLPLAAPAASPAAAAAPPSTSAASGVIVAFGRLALGPLAAVRPLTAVWRFDFAALLPQWCRVVAQADRVVAESSCLVAPLALLVIPPLVPRVAALRPTGQFGGEFIGSGLDGVRPLAGACPALAAVVEAAARGTRPRLFATVAAAAASTSTPPPSTSAAAPFAVFSRGLGRSAVFATAFAAVAARLGGVLIAAGAARWPRLGGSGLAGLLHRTGGRPPRSE